MKVVQDYPPNIEAIREVFPLTGSEIFAWGDIIYSPKGTDLPVWLLAHEDVHRQQQEHKHGEYSPEEWWARYLIDPEFRFAQELPAHQVEYQTFCAQESDRNRKRAFLRGLARRLSSPMYGRVASFDKAKRLIKS